MLNLYQMNIFQVVATEGSISKAAEALYLSQPAVSQHIGRLERELGVKLFERGRRGVRLTPAGEVLLGYAQNLFRLSQEAREATRRAASTAGKVYSPVHVGATPGIGSCLLPRWIKDFYTGYQQRILAIKIAAAPDLVHLVANQNLAFAVIGDHLNRAIIEVSPLWEEEAVIVVGRDHAWWQRPYVHAEELLNQTFVMRENRSLAHAWELQSLAEFGVNPQVVVEFTAPSAIKQALIANMGVALLPYFAIRHEVEMGLLHAVRLYEGTFRRLLSLLWTPASLKAPAVPILFRFLLENADSLAVQPLTSPARSVRVTFKQTPELHDLLGKGLTAQG